MWVLNVVTQRHFRRELVSFGAPLYDTADRRSSGLVTTSSSPKFLKPQRLHASNGTRLRSHNQCDCAEQGLFVWQVCLAVGWKACLFALEDEEMSIRGIALALRASLGNELPSDCR